MISSKTTENAVKPLASVYILCGICPSCRAKVECNPADETECIRDGVGYCEAEEADIDTPTLFDYLKEAE